MAEVTFSAACGATITSDKWGLPIYRIINGQYCSVGITKCGSQNFEYPGDYAVIFDDCCPHTCEPLDPQPFVEITEQCMGSGGGNTQPQDIALKDFVTICLTDRISDNPLELKRYYQLITREYDGSTFSTTSIGFYEDEGSTIPYTPVDPVDASTLGDDAVDSHNMTKLEGVGGWTSPALVRSYSVTVYAVGDLNNPPTFTDSDGVVTELPLNVAFDFHVDTELLETPVSIQTFAGDGVLITSTKYTT